MHEPDSGMLAAVEKVARFIATGDAANLEAFSDAGVAIVENFAPYLFAGADAVARWAAGMRVHAGALSDLRHTFGPAQDFSVTGERAFFSLPTRWTGSKGGQRFSEEGGWAFVLERQAGAWRVLGYGWAVTRLGPA